MLSWLYWKSRALVRRNDYLSKQLFRECLEASILRDPLLRFMLSRIEPRSVTYDIGAFIGAYSCALAEKKKAARYIPSSQTPRFILNL